MSDLWNIYDGEPWLDNPFVLLNRKRKRSTKKKGSKVMARRRRGRKAAPRRRRVARRRRAAVRSNPVRHYRRRRVSHRAASPRRRRGVRRFRRNPISIAGFNLKDLLVGGGSVIIAPMIEKQLLPLLPSSLSGTTTGRWAVKLGSALGTFYLAKVALGRRAGEVVAIALGSSLIADVVQEFAPELTRGVRAYPSGVRAYSPNNRLGLVMPGQVSRGLRQMGPAPGVRMGPGAMAAQSAIFAPPF